MTEDPALEARVEALLARMSLEQKVGQLIQAEIKSISPKEVRKYHIGSVLNGGGSHPVGKDGPVAGWVAAANAFYDASMDDRNGRLAIPIIWGTDAVHGHNNLMGATLYPHNIGLGATRNPQLIREIGAATARAVAVTGINWTFAPTVAVARDDRWGRTYESYAEDPALVAELGKQMVLGLQGHPLLDNFLGPDKVVATAKHFIGDGGTEKGDDQGDTLVDEATLRTVHAPGYFTTIGAGVQTVMASFSSWNGVKSHANHYLLTKVLKDRMGFDGFVVGDWDGHEQIPGCSKVRCPAAINAGVDMIMVPIEWRAFLRNTIRDVKQGEISEQRLNDAVRRILRVKMRAGLFERGRPSEQPFAARARLIGHDVHRALARQAVRESLVLLKNDGVLPLAADKRILVAGDGADNLPMQAGGWSVTWQGHDNSNADFPGATSVFAGIRDAAAAAGGEALLSPNGAYDVRPDAAIVVFGEPPYAEFEGDLEDSVAFEDGGKSLALLNRLRAEGIPTVAVFLSGRPLWLTPHLDAADAFVAAWLPGTEGGGIADVLLAAADGAPRHDFSGRLSFSWPKRPDQAPLNHGDANYDPLYPFGFGLRYQDSAAQPD
ncbi:MAG: hypothetical protein Tsb0016_04310 [Sphingomonadales bacterium]